MSIWADFLHQASYAGIEFDCLMTRDSFRRAIVAREFPRTDGGLLQDMGGAPRRTEMRACFFERAAVEGEDFEISGLNHLQRYAAFLAACRQGGTHDLVHPITGTHRAQVESFDAEAVGEEDDQIYVDVVFLEDGTAPAVFQVGTGLLPFDAGTAAVQVEAEQLTALLAASGMESDVPADASALATSWASSPELTVREVNLQLATAAAQIDAATETLELATNVANFPIYRSMQRVLWRLRQAAASFRQSQPQLITITLQADLPLRVVAAENYGAREADQRYGEMMRLNDIDDPSLVPAGTRIRAPARSAPKRTAGGRVAA